MQEKEKEKPRGIFNSNMSLWVWSSFVSVALDCVKLFSWRDLGSTGKERKKHSAHWPGSWRARRSDGCGLGEHRTKTPRCRWCCVHVMFLFQGLSSKTLSEEQKKWKIEVSLNFWCEIVGIRISCGNKRTLNLGCSTFGVCIASWRLFTMHNGQKSRATRQSGADKTCQ